MLKKIFVLLIIFFFSTTPVSAKDFYVSPNGNNSNDGSQNNPWKTIQYAVNQKNKVSGGDTIYIMPGTYHEAVVINGSTKAFEGQSANTGVQGTKTAPITIKGFSENNPPVITNGKNKVFQWLMIDVSNINVENIKFQDYYYSGFKVIAKNKAVSNINVKKLTLINQMVPDDLQVSWQGRFGILFSAPDYRYPIENVSLKDSYLDKIVTRRPAGDGHECIRVLGEVNHAVLENNTIGKCTNLGIDILGLDRAPNFIKAQPNYIVLRNNKITGMYKYLQPWVATPTAIYFDRAGNFILVENNKIMSNGAAANAVKTNVESYDGNLKGFGDIIIRGNLKVGKGPSYYIGIGTNSKPNTGQIKNGKFMDRIATVHNTSVTTDSSTPITYTGSRYTSTKNNVFTTKSSRMQFFPDWLANYSALTVNNRESNGNLWYTTANNTIWFWGPKKSYTGFNNYQSQTNQDKNSFFANPRFVNSTAGNYNLKPNTTGFEQGVALTKTTAAGGNTNIVPVADVKYFYDGWGIKGEVGDKIVVGNTPVTITKVDYSNKTLTVDKNITFSNNSKVNYFYKGSAPSIGLLADSFYDHGGIGTTPSPTPTIEVSPTPNANDFDVNKDGRVDIKDLIDLIKYIFGG